MNLVEQLFDRMDEWRHFPNYQLERRADLIFSLYLQQVLQSKTGVDINELFVPEFPVRIGSIYPNIPINKSYKIDYLAVSRAGDKAYLIELKTEGNSRRESQDKYLIASKKIGMTALLEGVLQIFHATQAKRKYYFLLKRLASMNLLEIPVEVDEIMQRESLRGINAAVDSIRITSKVASCEILYIQPNGEGDQIISFEEFANIIEQNDDLFAKRFSASLREWANVKAGY